MKTAWRHGVFGVDDADSKQAQCFYQEARDLKEKSQREKDIINHKRTGGKLKLLLMYIYIVLKLGLGTSDQMGIGSDLYKRSVSLHHEDV